MRDDILDPCKDKMKNVMIALTNGSLHVLLIFLCTCRPHVVNYNWLLDCMKQNQRLSEDPYKCLELSDNQQPFSPVSKPYV